ncbi:carboxymuconolactone decarboxylase family protein [Actinocatenispora sera]|uniref:carboxymuconolactone decarboxylase family protein n=1 Tax=Actinocatenispora sera TaxID=390989 RepID=UPI0033F0F030
MTNPAMVLPEAMKGIGSLTKAMTSGGVGNDLLEIVGLRASQINGCSPCVFAHARNLRKAGVDEDKIAAVAVWRHAPYFSDAEVAALKLTEAVTRLADRSDEPVSDELWDEVSKHFDEKQRAALILTISMLNFFNRINTTIQEPAGTEW